MIKNVSKNHWKIATCLKENELQDTCTSGTELKYVIKTWKIMMPSWKIGASINIASVENKIKYLDVTINLTETENTRDFDSRNLYHLRNYLHTGNLTKCVEPLMNLH